MKSNSVTIMSVLITYAIIIGGYAFWLTSTYQSSSYMLEATNGMAYVPEVLWPTIIEGGYKALLTTILLVTMHTLFYTGLTLIAGIVIGHFAFPVRTRAKSRPKQTVDRLRHDDSEYRITVVAPDSIDPVTHQPREGKALDTLFDDTQIRLRRSEIKSKRAPETPIEELELALLQTLYAHKDYPADPAGHHSQVGMYDHSIRVMQRMKESSDHPLAKAVGLGHDIGKLLAYKKTAEGWQITSKRHDRMSGEIVRHLPEFQRLKEDDRRTLSRVLSYAHAKKLPRTLSTEARELIQTLKVADGLTTSDDRQTSETALTNANVMETVRRVIDGLLPEININNYMGREHAEGWTIEGVEYVAILESKLRENIAGQLPHSIAQVLQAYVNVDSTSHHPMTRAIVSTFEDMELLTNAVGSGDSRIEAHEGLFDIKVGRQKFVDVLLLDKEKLAADRRINLKRWGSAGYNLRVRKSRRAKEASI